MRKIFKLKKRSCALCKPNKMGWASRWNPKELFQIKEFAKIKHGFNYEI
ncbi:MAG: hypothetical protein AAB453_04290 [Patescibacteria group bacterium]